MNGTTAYALSKKYVEDTSISLGAVKGAPCTIKSITEVDGGQKVTFEWTGTSGTKQTSEMTVKNGVSVTGISDKGNGVFTLLLSDGSETDPIQCVKGEKGDKGDKLTFNDLTDEEKASLKGEPGVSPTITENADNTDKIYKLDITTADSTFTTPNLKGADGQGGSGGSGEENKIDSISVNGVNVVPDENKNVDITVPSIDGLAKTEDIPTKVSELTNDSGYLTEHQDISGKVDKVDGKSLIADTEIERLASVDNYDDTQVKTQIQSVANGLMDSVGYSADYKTIDIIAKNGVKKSVNVAPIISHASITELSDVDTTNKATGKALVYNATTSKHEYADVSGTDEKVKMDSSTDAKYLGELLDNITIANENGKLKVKKLDGQEVTITEINYLKGLTMNVMDLVNMFSNGGVKIINTPVATYAELLTLDKSSFIEGVSYLVYVLADENHDNAKTTYLVDKDSEIPTYFGFADSQRDFTTNPIDLATEITGKLGISNMDSDAIKALFTVDNTYKTETATNNAFSTHGAKALYDELLLAIGNKANDSDLTAHKDDATIHVSTEDRTKWDSAKTHADSAHAPSNAQENVLETVKVNNQEITPDENKAVNIDLSDYAKTTDIPTTLPANGGNSDTVNNHTVETDVPTDAVFTDTIYDDTEVKGSIEEVNSNLDTLEFGEIAGGKNLLDIEEKIYSNSVTDEKTSFIATLKVNNTWAGAVNVTGNGIFSITFDITDSNINNIKLYHSGSHVDITLIYKDIYLDVGKYTMSFDAIGCNPQVVNGIKIQKIQIEEGTTATPYEPYIPSVKMLAEENEQQNTEAMDLKMLGWTVPSECPVQNYVDSNGVFHQRVGRVDLGSLDWSINTNYNYFLANVMSDLKFAGIPSTVKANMFCYKYITVVRNDNFTDKQICVDGSISKYIYLNIKDSTYTDATTFKTAMKGVYLYYELETEITKTIDGNEAVEELSSNLSQLEFGEIAGGKNLFKGDFIKKVLDPDINYTDIDLSKEQNSIKNIEGITFVVFGAYLKKGTYTFSYTNNAYFSLNRIAIAGTNCINVIESIRKSYTWTQNADGWTYFGIEGDDSETGVTDTPFSITPNIQIEKGTQATEYEPYIPSVKMIAEENAQQSSDLDGLGYGENGAKNLFKDYDVMQSYTISSETYNGYQVIYSDQQWMGAFQSDLFLKSGITYTISAYVKGNGYAFVFSTSKDGFIGGKKIALTDNFERFSLVYTPNEDVTNIRIENETDGGLYIACFQIEEGDTATPYKPYIPSVKMLAENVKAQNENLGAYDINENATSSYSKSNGFAIEWLKMCKATKGTYKLSYTINGSTGGSSEIALGKSINDKTLYRNIGLISDGMYEQIIDITSDTDIYIMVYTNGSITISNIKFTLQNIANEVGNLKNDLVPKKIELQNVDERVTIQDNGSFIINGFAFVNLLVTFNETLPQWSNFVRLPRPKGDDVPVHCENSVRFTIYGQDNLPGDCGTYDVVQSGTEIRLLVNYEVA